MKIVFGVYLTVLLALTIFSFSQIDPLLYAAAWGQTNRFFWGSLLTAILAVLTVCYLYFVFRLKKLPGWVVILTVLITFPAYPAAFSHDIFNYIFHAKIPAFYQQNPFVLAPNDFPADPLLPLVHWRDSVSRYGPVWMALTVPLYSLGAGSLVMLLYLFKGLMVAFYIGGAVLMRKLGGAKALIFFIFNPLLIIDGLVNPHTDIVLSFFVLLAFYLLLNKHRLAAFGAVLLSAGVKIVTLPVFLGLLRKPSITVFLLLAYAGSAIIIAKWSINPWYLTLPVILTSLSTNKFWRYLAISLAVAAVVRYLPYVFLGYFDPNFKIRLWLFLAFMAPFGFWVLRSGKKYLRRFWPSGV